MVAALVVPLLTACGAIAANAAPASAFAPPTYAKLASGPLRVRGWSGKPFIFLNYGGPWLACRGDPALTRLAVECQRQHLLTATWSDPNFIEPLESIDSEWDTNLLQLMEQQFSQKAMRITRHKCYALARRYYLARNHTLLYPGEYRGFNTSDGRFFTMTGHSYYSVYGAQWGCSLLGIELGENIISSQSKIAFARGAARQNGKPLYADVSPWDAGLNSSGRWIGMIPVFGVGEGGNERRTPPIPAAEVFHNPSLSWTGGHSPSLLCRLWYVCWLSGFSVVVPEDCQRDFFAYSTSERNEYVSPTIFVPRNPSRRAKLSPLGRRARKFLSVVDAHPSRGIPYAPFAVMIGRHSGFGAYALTFPRPWGVLKPTLSDREVQLFWNTVFPGSMDIDQIIPSNEPDESHRLVAGPFGDCFDVLLTNARERILRCYPVLTLLGHISFSASLISRLKRYVSHGGLLCVPYHQIRELGTNWESIRSLGRTEAYGFHGSHPRPVRPDTRRWLDTAVWGMSPAQVRATKATRRLQPYEVYYESQVRKLFTA